MTRRILVALILAALAASAAVAHQFQMSEFWTMIGKDGAYRIDVLIDVDMLLQIPYESLISPLAAPPPPENPRLPTEQELRQFMTDQIKVMFDEKPVGFDVSFVSLTEKDVGYWSQVPLPRRSFRLSGRIPEHAQNLTVKASTHFGAVALSIRKEGAGTAVNKMVFPGSASSAYRLTE